ncbi:MAG: iron-containing alcohol dehydrogenase [Verrucomicrobia bacterium]|nr:iron-containing alcohol dehydrogenase [Verrucomicrobiota bacterium]
METAAALGPITLLQPGKIFFGNGSVATLAAELAARDVRKVLLVTSPGVIKSCSDVLSKLEDAGVCTRVYAEINAEPTVQMFEACLRVAREQPLDGIVGLGGGSPMDVAKLVAALATGTQSVRDVFGINLLHGRRLFLACLPTTSGTGSEVSPNAILLDESCQLKKGVISPHLVPDVACVDPLLTCSVPPAITAATGLDALTHCIEAYANRFAHPTVDLYALQGIRLISQNLLAAIADGRDTTARANLALGSLYGGLCLGPVNTAAVHALAYPLGGEFHIAHGISNAVLLPHVLRFNLPAMPERYAHIAVALGAQSARSPAATAERGIERLDYLMARCPMQRRISEFNVPQEALPRLAKAAMTVTRLLKNNPRTLTEQDALQIYHAAW